MKIHGTAEGAALSTKDFGVAFGDAAAESTELWSQTGTGENEGLQLPKTILGQRFQTGQTLIGKTITRFDANLRKVSSPTGIMTGEIINSSNVQQLNMGTIDVSTLTTEFVTHTFENTDGYELKDGDRIGFSYESSGDNYPSWQMGTATISNTNGGYYTGSWNERSYSFTMAVYGY